MDLSLIPHLTKNVEMNVGSADRNVCMSFVRRDLELADFRETYSLNFCVHSYRILSQTGRKVENGTDFFCTLQHKLAFTEQIVTKLATAGRHCVENFTRRIIVKLIDKITFLQELHMPPNTDHTHTHTHTHTHIHTHHTHTHTHTHTTHTISTFEPLHVISVQ